MAQAQAIAGENYEFKAAPEQQALQPSEDQKIGCSLLGCNIMYDKRVVRGNTYASIQTQGDKKLMTLKSFKKPQQKSTQQPQTTYLNPSTPRPFQNRVNIDIQTDEYLEILTDKPPEQEMDAQTDYYIDKPPDRLFVPKKNGIDKETQIWEGDLFDFDQEVESVLQVLMNKILEQSRMEVLEEEEIKLMKLNTNIDNIQKKIYYILSKNRVIKKQFVEIYQNNLLILLNKIQLKSYQIQVFLEILQKQLYYMNIYHGFMISQLADEIDNACNFNNMLNYLEETITNQHSNSLKRRQQQIDDKYEEIARRKREKEDKKRMEEERRLKEIEDQRLAEEEAARQADQEILDQQQENQQQQQQQLQS